MDSPAEVKRLIATVPEEIQVEVLLTFGSVFHNPREGVYWNDVWKWLQVRHGHLLRKPAAVYPRDVHGSDLALLSGMYWWQREQVPEDRR